MSGQLVGEVIAASHAFRAAGLSERGFHALVAITEKCHTQTRQGSVPWKHIRKGLFGASKRTAERAVQDLKTFGAIRVVKCGFNNNAGRVCAPIYEIESLTDTDTQVTRSGWGDTDKPGSDTDKLTTDTDKPGDRYRHLGDVLNGPFNLPFNGPFGDSAAGPDCGICRDGGIVLNSDGCPGNQIRICHHDGSWHPATPEELTDRKAIA